MGNKRPQNDLVSVFESLSNSDLKDSAAIMINIKCLCSKVSSDLIKHISIFGHLMIDVIYTV